MGTGLALSNTGILKAVAPLSVPSVTRLVMVRVVWGY